MFLNFVYGHPTWLVGLLMVIAAVAYGCLGVLIVDRLVPIETRRGHNEMVGYILAVAGVNYAVLLGFVAVSVWQSFDTARDVVTKEANLLADITRDANGLPDAEAVEIHQAIHRYVDRVINEEWPAMATGASSHAGWGALVRVSTTLKKYEPQTETEKIFAAELLHQLNDLYDARRSRETAAESGVEPVIWMILLLLAAMIIGFTFLLGMDSRAIHMALTGLLAAGTALVMLLIVAMDWPFRGEVQISPDVFMRIANNMRAIEAPP